MVSLIIYDGNGADSAHWVSMHAVLLGVVHIVLRAGHVTVVSAVILIREGKCWCLAGSPMPDSGRHPWSC